MILAAQVLIIFLIIFVVLLQPTDVRAVFDDDIDLEISLTFFAIKFYSLTKKSKKQKQKFTKRWKTAAFSIRLANYLIRHSAVILRAYHPFSPDILNTKASLIATALASPALLLYIRQNCAEYTESEQSDAKLDISFSFSLVWLFIYAAKASYYKLKSVAKELG